MPLRFAAGMLLGGFSLLGCALLWPVAPARTQSSPAVLQGQVAVRRWDRPFRPNPPRRTSVPCSEGEKVLRDISLQRRT